MQFEHNSLLILHLLINTSRHPNAHSRHHHHYHYYGSLTRSLAVRINRTITPTPPSLPLAAARRSLDGFRSTNQSSRRFVDDASLAFQIFINGIEIETRTWINFVHLNVNSSQPLYSPLKIGSNFNRVPKYTFLSHGWISCCWRRIGPF